MRKVIHPAFAADHGILKGKFPSLKSHQPPLNCQNRYYRLYMCKEVKPSLNRRVVFQMVETGNGDFLEYNIYLTRGWGPNMVSFP